MSDLSGRRAVVTGAASGIGLASAEAMLNLNATVVLADRDEVALASVCTRLGERAIPLTVDLLNPESCGGMVARAVDLMGGIDILHANAGSYVGGDLVDSDADAVDRMLSLNINAVVRNVHSVIQPMAEGGGGDIVITSSVAGHVAVPWEPAYSASKWAMTSFVQTMRRQLRNKGIRVGSVSPGPVVSALLADWPEENLRKARESGSLIEPSDVAEAIVFMLTRPRNVCIRDVVILPTNFDI